MPSCVGQQELPVCRYGCLQHTAYVLPHALRAVVRKCVTQLESLHHRHPWLNARFQHLQGLLTLLVALLSRGSVRLLVLVTTFLRKLSVAADNRAELRELEVVGQLAALLPGQSGAAGGSAGQEGGAGQLLSSVLRLLHNLSLDRGMRQQMVAAGMVGKVAGLLELELDGPPSSNGVSSSAGDAGDARPASITGQPAAVAMQAQGEHLLLQQAQQNDGLGQTNEGPYLLTLVLGLLYHLSLQDKHRSMFLYTGEPYSGHPVPDAYIIVNEFLPPSGC